MTHSPAEQQIILIGAGVAARRTAMTGHARSLMGEIDWVKFEETLRLRKLLPVLGPRILDLAEGATSEDFGAAVEHALVAGRRQGALLQLTAMRLMSMLSDAGIPSAALKGPLLSESIYGDPGRRLSNDVDLLVAPKQLLEAVEVVRKLGYDLPDDHVGEDGLPQLHFALVHSQAGLPPVELHWRIHWYERSFALNRLLPPPEAPVGDWRPDPADELAALLLFYARDAFIDLRLATDLSAWWDKYNEELEPGALGALIRLYPALDRVLTVSARVAERIVGVPAARILEEMRKPNLRDRIAIRMANPNPSSSRPQLYADKGLIDGLLTPTRDLSGFVHRELLPPREVREVHALHSGRQRAHSSPVRAIGVLGRYALTLIRLIKPREPRPEN